MTLDQLKDKIGIGEDKVYGVIGAFSNPDELVEAGRRIREMGYTKLDAMTPFPVHGIDEAIGVPPSKLGWIVVWFSAMVVATSLADFVTRALMASSTVNVVPAWRCKFDGGMDDARAETLRRVSRLILPDFKSWNST